MRKNLREDPKTKTRPEYRAEVEMLALQAELDKAREVQRVLERCGLKGGKEYRRLNAECTGLNLRMKDKSEEVMRQHRACGRAVAKAFLALDLLNEALDGVADTFDRNCVLTARNSGLEFVEQCRQFARECNHQVCVFAADDKLDQAFADTSEVVLERLHAAIDEALDRDEFKMLR